MMDLIFSLVRAGLRAVFFFFTAASVALVAFGPLFYGALYMNRAVTFVGAVWVVFCWGVLEHYERDVRGSSRREP